jgi:ATP-dependent Clp protease ATP-binding subunit ClpC
VRDAVAAQVTFRGPGPFGAPPFTPGAKKVLELALREARQLGYDHIGAEHLLLGLVREGEGVAARTLASLGAEVERVRQAVLGLLAGQPPERRLGPRATMVATARPGGPPPICMRCGTSLASSARYASLEVPPAEPPTGDEPLTARIVFCSSCGGALGIP